MSYLKLFVLSQSKIFLLVCVCVYIYIYIYITGPRDQSSIPGRVIPRTQNIVLDSSMLNTKHNKVWIKSKWSNTGKRIAPSLHLGVVPIEYIRLLSDWSSFILPTSISDLCLHRSHTYTQSFCHKPDATQSQFISRNSLNAEFSFSCPFFFFFLLISITIVCTPLNGSKYSDTNSSI